MRIDESSRRLREVDGWYEETAYDVAGDAQNALALLTHYDEH